MSPKFLLDIAQFTELFGKFQMKITVATGLAQTYLSPSVLYGSSPPVRPEPHQETGQESSETWQGWGLSVGKVVVTVAALVLCYAGVYLEWLPQEVFVWFLAGALALMFLPATFSALPKLVRFLRKKDEEDELKSLAKRLKEINDDLTQMNEDYVYHYWLVKDSRVGKLSR